MALVRQNPFNEAVTNSSIAKAPLIFDGQVRKGCDQRFREQPPSIARHAVLPMNPNAFEATAR
jgi:hypothetical protein